MNEAARRSSGNKTKNSYIQAPGTGESASLPLPGDRCANVTVSKPPILHCQDEQMDDEFIGEGGGELTAKLVLSINTPLSHFFMVFFFFFSLYYLVSMQYALSQFPVNIDEIEA